MILKEANMQADRLTKPEKNEQGLNKMRSQQKVQKKEPKKIVQLEIVE